MNVHRIEQGVSESIESPVTFSDSDQALVARIAVLLAELGPFPANAPRSAKWRTTEQLANDVTDSFEGNLTLARLDDVLTRYEAVVRERLTRGESPAALIRRSTYPDRTTALPLWGSTKHHGEPWLGQAPATRVDEPVDLPAQLQVPDSAPRVFLSHTRHDSDLAYRVAADLARFGFGSWMFESHIEQRRTIADCVRHAITEAIHCLAVVTRDSVASLWVLTELHTALQAGVRVSLVVDASDEALMKLLQSVRFPHPGGMFDMSVTYDNGLLARMRMDYAQRHSASRAARYEQQVHDFLATLPLYLSGRTALAYPEPPGGWTGIIPLAGLEQLRSGG